MPLQHQIEMNVVEADQIVAAIIYIIEHVDDYQTELLRHSAVTLSWCVRDRLASTLQDVMKIDTDR